MCPGRRLPEQQPTHRGRQDLVPFSPLANIGFAAGLPLLIKNNFESQRHRAITYAWTGPFIGALMRWVGDLLSGRLGGAGVTLLSFVGMAVSRTVVIFALPADGDQGSFWAFFSGFCATCMAGCRWFYARKGAEAPS